MPLISIVTPCFNEEEDARELYDRIQKTGVHAQSTG